MENPTPAPAPAPCGCPSYVALLAEKRQLERRLQEALAAAEAASEAKSVFLGNISHEIRTPLNGMIAVSQLLLCTTLTREQRELGETLQESGQALLSVLGDVLDFSCIDRNDLELQVAPLWVRDAVEACLEGVAAEAARLGVRAAYRLDADLATRRVRADPVRVRQVVASLLSNAVKFNREGGEVVVEVGVAPGGADVLVAVSDSGIGIEPGLAERLFEGFRQGEESMTRRHGGTGLGLAIAGRLAALMGGSIRVDTVAGQGSVFSFSFPLEWARDSMSSLPQVSPAEAAALLPRTSAPPPAPRQQPLDARLDWGPAHGRACRSQGGAASQASAGARSGATDAPPTPGGARPGAPAPRFGGGSDSSLGGSFAYFGASGAASTIALTSNSRRSSGDDSQGSLEPALPSASSSGGGASSGPAPARRPPLPPPPVDFRSSAFYSSGDSAGAASPMSRPSAEEERPSAAAGLARGPPQLMAPPPPRASPLAGRTVVVDVEHEPLALQIVDSCALFGMSARRGACDAGADAGAPAADFCVTTADRAQAALRGGWKGRPLVALGWKDNMPLQIQPTVTVVPLPVKHARLLAALLQAAAFQLCTRNAAAHSDPALLSLLSDRHPLGRVGASRRSVDNSALERSKVVPLSAAALQQRDSLDAPSSAAAAATGSWMPTLATVRSLATSATPRSSLDSQRPARFAAIAEDAAEGEGEGAGAAPAAAAAGEPLERADSWPLLPRILVAEDNPINVRVVLRVLGHVLPGAAVDVVGNGVEVLAAVRRRAYGLVLMDVHMPEMDGLEAARRLTAALPAADRPLIVALSADTMQALPDRCRAAGMADFVSKPFRIEDVRRIVRLMVDRQQATAVAGALERAAAP